MCNWNQDYSIILWKDYLFQERRKKKISLIWDTCDVSVEGVADFGKCGAVTLTCLCPWVKRSAKKSLGQTSLTVQEAKINSSATPWELLTAFWGQGKVQWPKESWALEISVPLDSPPRQAVWSEEEYGVNRQCDSYQIHQHTVSGKGPAGNDGAVKTLWGDLQEGLIWM